MVGVYHVCAELTNEKKKKGMNEVPVAQTMQSVTHGTNQFVKVENLQL